MQQERSARAARCNNKREVCRLLDATRENATREKCNKREVRGLLDATREKCAGCSMQQERSARAARATSCCDATREKCACNKLLDATREKCAGCSMQQERSVLDGCSMQQERSAQAARCKISEWSNLQLMLASCGGSLLSCPCGCSRLSGHSLPFLSPAHNQPQKITSFTEVVTKPFFVQVKSQVSFIEVESYYKYFLFKS